MKLFNGLEYMTFRSWSNYFRENEFPNDFFSWNQISCVLRRRGSHLIQMLLKVGQKGWHGNFNKGKVDGLTVNPIFIAITTDFSGRFTIWLKYFKSCSRHVQKWSVFRQNKSCFQLYFRKLYRNAELDRILRKVTWNTCTFQCY